MAKIRTITVGFAWRSGFKHSHSSCEQRIDYTVELEPGEDEKEVRAKLARRAKAVVVKEVKEFKEEHDVPQVRER